MKGSPMKEKIILTVSLVFLAGIIWISNMTTKIANPYPLTSKESISPLNNNQDFIDDVFPEVLPDVESSIKSIESEIETCVLGLTKTETLTFRDAFQYYRQCLGPNGNFQWKGKTYTTLLAKDAIIQIADSSQVKGKTDNNNDISETR
tara:strand:- start:361 stop:804 length:444 start_codon:yes stop_codon:yes gene_type:complete